MPNTLPAPLYQIKDQTSSFQPVLLCQFVFQDGSFLYVSTHPLNQSEGGQPAPDYFGTNSGQSVNYLARVTQQSLGALQALSAQGIGRITKVQLRLANADESMWSFYEIYPGPGFRGAMLTIRLCSWQVGTANFSTDAPVKFAGTCDPAYLDTDGTILVIEANNSHNTAAVKLPDVPIQNRCPWSFPSTAVQRLDGATNPASQFWQCGYCPDQSATAPDGTPVPIGNFGPPNVKLADGTAVTDASGIYVSCDYTRSSGASKSSSTTGCMARLGNYNTSNIAPDGDLQHDQSGRKTGRFGGIQWSPGNKLVRSRSYETGSWIDVLQYQNATIFGGFHNVVYGQQWVAPKVANVIEDANSTRCEAVLFFGKIGPLITQSQSGSMLANYVFSVPGDPYSGTFTVLLPPDYVTQANVTMAQSNGLQILTLNGVQVPFSGSDVLFTWSWVTLGARTGMLNASPSYSSPPYLALGDIYGSLATILVTVYRDLWDGGSTPNLQALVAGSAIRRFDGTNVIQDYSPVRNSAGSTVTFSPAWVLLDILIQANYQYSDIDLRTFVVAAAFTDAMISYQAISGATQSHSRYVCEFAITQRRTAADIIDAVLRSFDAYLTPSDKTGKLQLFIRQTLADQQAVQIPGSNYNGSLASIHADGTAGTGYPAYFINESIVARNPINGAVQLSMVATPNSQVPNEIVIQFQDSENQYQSDSLTQVEPMSVARCGGTFAGGQPGGAVVPESINILGINNFDQAYRIANRHLWEMNYGNEVGDARGTRVFEVGIASGIRTAHLRIGHLVLVNYAPAGISNQLFRVSAIAPGQNYESCKLTLNWHEDSWYTDAFAQKPRPYYSNNGPDATRAPYPWRPNLVKPNNTSFQSALGFSINENYLINSDGTYTVTVVIGGETPVNSFDPIGPLNIPLQGVSSPGGGTIKGPVDILMAICLSDAAGNINRPSRFAKVHIPAGVINGTAGIDLTGVPWPAGATGWFLFAGTSETTMCLQASGTSTSTPNPSATSFNSLLVGTEGMPDQFFHHFKVLAKQVISPGPISGVVSAVTPTSISINVGNFTNSVTGPTVTQDFTGYYISLYNKPNIAAGIADFLISASAPVNTYTVTEDPTPFVNLGDIVVIRAKADISSANTIGCSLFVNDWIPTGIGIGSKVGLMARIIGGTGAGQTALITSNTATTCTLSANWAVTPDATSLFIIEATPTWLFTSEKSVAVTATRPGTQTSLSVDVTNYSNQALLVMVQTVNANGDSSPEALSPIREMWIYGSPPGGSGIIAYA